MTKKERLQFYKRLLKVVCDDPDVDFGFCYYIYNITLKSGNAKTCTNMEYNFPELWAKKPERIIFPSEYWFPRTSKGWEKRIALLEEVIHEMEYFIKSDEYL